MIPADSIKLDKKFIPSLIKWYNKAKISYPWTESNSAYKIWISEIMLQQTVVKTVVPFYNKWLQRFPDAFTLAEVSEEEVLFYWQGLGYYSRARNIHKTALILKEKYRGKLPANKKSLLSLPGIGEYTASAILSLAFGQSQAVFDANVKRIFQRLFNKAETNPAFFKQLQASLLNKLKQGNPIIINNALMQFGQLICKKKKPNCQHCFYQNDCLAYQHETAAQIPRPQKTTYHIIHSSLLLLENKKKLAFFQAKDKLKGLWRPPRINHNDQENWEKHNIGLIQKKGRLKKRIHSYTHFKEHIKPIIYTLREKNDLECLEEKPLYWYKQDEYQKIPMAPVYRKIINDYIEGKIER